MAGRPRSLGRVPGYQTDHTPPFAPFLENLQVLHAALLSRQDGSDIGSADYGGRD